LSFTLDANVLLYASDEASEYHERARAPRPGSPAATSSSACSGRRRWRTSGSRLTPPSSSADDDRFWPSYRRVSAEADARGNLVSDAQIVGLMTESSTFEGRQISTGSS
jgi:hypothetical protein